MAGVGNELRIVSANGEGPALKQYRKPAREGCANGHNATLNPKDPGPPPRPAKWEFPKTRGTLGFLERVIFRVL